MVDTELASRVASTDAVVIEGPRASGETVTARQIAASLEVDAIVEAAAGHWAAFEVKLGRARIDEAAATLRKFAERVDPDRCGRPSALGVIVPSGYGYVRDDGVAVIPIGALGP